MKGPGFRLRKRRQAARRRLRRHQERLLEKVLAWFPKPAATEEDDLDRAIRDAQLEVLNEDPRSNDR